MKNYHFRKERSGEKLWKLYGPYLPLKNHQESLVGNLDENQFSLVLVLVSCGEVIIASFQTRGYQTWSLKVIGALARFRGFQTWL
jgi:hypothetical protein